MKCVLKYETSEGLDMERKLKVLGIAPYEGLKTLMEIAKEEYPNIQLDTFVGDLDLGFSIARKNFHNNYDAVISRGMTAKLIHNLPIPVIDIEISLYDLLCACRLANTETTKTAVVSYTDMTEMISSLQSVTGYRVDNYTVKSVVDAESILNGLQNQGYEAFLCDMVVDGMARQLGMNSYLITSGPDSIHNAFKQVLKTCENLEQLKDENLLLRRLVQNQMSQTVLFDDEKNVILSTLNDPDDKVTSMLKDEIEETKNAGVKRIIRNRAGYIYSIKAECLEKGYTAFHFTERKSSLQQDRTGIKFLTLEEAKKEFYGSLFDLAGTLKIFSNQIDRLKNSPDPIMITGEYGTGKESLANYIYINSSKNNSPFVVVDCHLLDDKGWEFLYEHHSSPLVESGLTMYFKNIDRIPVNKTNSLRANLIEMEVCTRNKVIFSCTLDNGRLPYMGSILSDSLKALSILIPPLREQIDAIPLLFNRTISNLNTELPQKIAGADTAAMEALMSYQWPHNLSQFERVVSELALTNNGNLITEESVSRVIQKEQYVGYESMTEESYNPINLHKPLKEIECDIVARILEETGGNHTEAASILDISRTTLWRIEKTINGE